MIPEELNPGGSILPLLGRLDLEHEFRYNFAIRLVPRGPSVDFGCGYGLGTSMLAKSRTEQVLGLDIDAHAVEFARRHYPSSNLTFQLTTGVKIPLPSGSISLLSCFEVIEHLHPTQLHSFLGEAHRVLRPDGIMVGSTPNGLLSGNGKNPFHIHEFSSDELIRIATEHAFSASLSSQGVTDTSGNSVLRRLFEATPASLSASRAFRVVFSLLVTASGRSHRAKRQAVISEYVDVNRSRTLLFAMSPR
jgi:2-polyprenyl-3-methyl-5-hydroxy-6-metoxy-1,4-benzoquinol methylase